MDHTIRVTPICKEGDWACKANYRPISLQPVVARPFEKLIFDQLCDYRSKKFNILGPICLQKLHSTVTCSIKDTDKWYRGMDNNCISGKVFVDLRNAFDTVDHSIICLKLEHYGLQLN